MKTNKILTQCSLQSSLAITSASIYFPYMLDLHVSSLLKNTNGLFGWRGKEGE